jgi:hypothetical protein
MTHYPKRAGAFQILAGKPEGENDIIVDYTDSWDEATKMAKGVSKRPDATRGVVVEVSTGRELLVHGVG